MTGGIELPDIHFCSHLRGCFAFGKATSLSLHFPYSRLLQEEIWVIWLVQVICGWVIGQMVLVGYVILLIIYDFLFGPCGC